MTGYDFYSHWRGKKHYDTPPVVVGQEHSHLCGKKCLSKLGSVGLEGTLPLTWEKDSVFMRLSEVFTAICTKNFCKNLVLFLPAAMFALS